MSTTITNETGELTVEPSAEISLTTVLETAIRGALVALKDAHLITPGQFGQALVGGAIKGVAIQLASRLQTPSLTPPPATSTTSAIIPTEEEKLQANNWAKSIRDLSAENPGDWDDHFSKMGKLTGLSDWVRQTMLDKFLEKGRAYGVGFDEKLKRFFLMDIPQIEEPDLEQALTGALRKDN